MDLKLQLTEDKTLNFKQHVNFENSIVAVLKLDNGYGASVITRKPLEGYSGLMTSAHGSWDDDTFELGIINHSGQFICIDEIEENDEKYRFNYGIWPNLSKDQLIEKIQMISNLQGE